MQLLPSMMQSCQMIIFLMLSSTGWKHLTRFKTFTTKCYISSVWGLINTNYMNWRNPLSSVVDSDQRGRPHLRPKGLWLWLDNCCNNFSVFHSFFKYTYNYHIQPWKIGCAWFWSHSNWYNIHEKQHIKLYQVFFNVDWCLM